MNTKTNRHHFNLGCKVFSSATKKIDNANFEVYIGMIDADYYKKKYGNIPGDYGEINSAKYLISKNITTNKWTYQFINFETSN